MAAIDSKLKPVESGSTTFQTNVVKSTSLVAGNQLCFTLADRTDLTVRPYGNLFVSFNLPVLSTQFTDFTSGGTYYNTAVSGANTNQVIVASIPENTYGELIDGKTISFSFPIVQNGLNEVITCYGTYFNNNTNSSQGNGNNIFSDSQDTNPYFGQEPSISNSYNSNVAFLFSNNVLGPQYNTGATWNAWTTGNKFDSTGNLSNTSAKQYAQFRLGDNGVQSVDKAVGVAYLDKGFYVIWDPLLVNNFAYSAATSSGYDGITSGSTYTGGPTYTQVYFANPASANTSFTSIITEYVQNVFALAMMNEFYQSSNPTFQSVYANGNPNNEPVYITEIGLYNANKELIGIAKTNEPIPKNSSNILTFNIQLKI